MARQYMVEIGPNPEEDPGPDIGGSNLGLAAGQLDEFLNERAGEGWHLDRIITPYILKGMGFGAVDDGEYLVVFRKDK